MPPQSSPFASEGNRIAANALFDSVKQTRSIALVGAGLSISAGYPSWENLLMLLEAGVRRTSPFYNSALLSLRNRRDPLWRAQELRRYLGEDRYFSLLREIFRPSGQQALMVDGLLTLPFRHFLTTNFDPLLEESSYRKSVPATTIDWTNDSDVSEFLFRLQGFGVRLVFGSDEREVGPCFSVLSTINADAPDTKDVRARNNAAVLKLKAPGPFTVGIEVYDEPYTVLELDLATCAGWS